MFHRSRKLAKNSVILGVDIGSNSIKFLEIMHINSVYRIDACAEIPIDDIALRFKSFDFHTRATVVAVPDQKIMMKTFLLDTSLNEFEIEEHIQLEAEHYFGYPASDIAFDFKTHPLPGDDKKQTVSVVAAKQNEIANRLNLLKTLNLKVIAVDVESHAVARAIQLQHYKNAAFMYSRENILFLLARQGHDIVFKQEPLIGNETIEKPITRMLSGLIRNTVYPQVEHILVLHNEAKINEFIRAPLSIPLKIINPLREMLVSSNCAKEVNDFAQWTTSCGLAMWSFHES